MADSERGSAELQAPPAHDDRERAIQTLTGHFAQGVLSEDEVEARFERVYQAQTHAELAAVTADLPAAGAAIERASAPGRITALFSGHEAKLDGPVPARIVVRARAGYAQVDLRRAEFGDGVTEIDVRAFAGYVQLYLPAGVTVESHGGALAGYFAVRGKSSPGSSRAVVRITGRATCGFVECFVSKPDDGERGDPALPR